MLPGAVSRCPWQDRRVVILPHLVQKSQTAQPCLRMMRQCLVTKGAAHVGVSNIWLVSPQRTPRANIGIHYLSSTSYITRSDGL